MSDILSGSRWKRHLLFGMCALLYFWLIGHFDYFHLPPGGIHFIRQTDSLSFIQHFLLTDDPLYMPGTLNLYSHLGRSACEFPILYQVAAMVDQWGIDPPDTIRGLSLVLTFISLFCVFERLFSALKEFILPMALTLTLYSSTIWLYYSNSFIPDSFSVALTLIGLCAYLRLSADDALGRHGHWTWSGVFIVFLTLTLAALMKPTYALFPIAIGISIIIQRLRNKETGRGSKMALALLSLLFIGGVITAVWISYASSYNVSNSDFYFLTTIRPIWSIDAEHRSLVWTFISDYWYGQYHHRYFYYALCLMIGISLLWIRRWADDLKVILLFCILGTASYIVLFYSQFKDHDYYMLLLIPLAFLIMLAWARSMARLARFSLPYLLAMFLVAGVGYHSLRWADAQYEKRMAAAAAEPLSVALAGADDYLDGLGIPRKATFLVIIDKTWNGALHFIGRMGWPIWSLDQEGMERIDVLIDHGAEYVLIDAKELEAREGEFSPYLGEQIGEYGGFLIYKSVRSAE